MEFISQEKKVFGNDFNGYPAEKTGGGLSGRSVNQGNVSANQGSHRVSKIMPYNGYLEISRIIRRFIIEQFLLEEDNQLQDGTSFLESGVIDSTGIMELVTFAEETFGITLKDEELIPENLDSIHRIALYIQMKQGVVK